jgi:hypothetical protein
LVASLFVASLATVGVAAQPPFFATVSSVATGSINAVGIAFVNTLGSVGGFAGPYLLGYGMDAAGGLAIPCIGAAMVMAAGAVLTLLSRERARVPRAMVSTAAAS